MRRESIPTPVRLDNFSVEAYRSVPANQRQVPVIVCTGCAQPIAAPRLEQRSYECPSCGKRMNVVGVNPAVALPRVVGLRR